MTVRFLDTSFLVALNAVDDQSHESASKYWIANLANRIPLVTTTSVLDEALTLFNSRGQHGLAVTVGRQLLGSSAISMLHVDERLLDRGWKYFVKHGDKRYSLTDCISFVVMEERGLRQSLTFDQHFAQAGFECLPERVAG